MALPFFYLTFVLDSATGRSAGTLCPAIARQRDNRRSARPTPLPLAFGSCATVMFTLVATRHPGLSF